MLKATGAKKRKAANGYKLAEPLPLGEILKDISKKEWKLGPSIGQGGFGEIYSAKEATSKGSQYPYVIKIEPHANGPLFVEMHFYMRNAKPEDVEAFKKKNGLNTFGMPLYLGSGSHEYNGEKYRFIVMEKFGSDLWKIFLENNRIFPTTTVFQIAVQILDVLEYIHSKGYVHADIKAANILMGVTKETKDKQFYLVDFGLATKYNNDTNFKPNPKKAHDGTIEYLSRDAHLGVQTRRGDLEVLAYNIIQWLGCVLPWEKKLTNPNEVQKSKEEHMMSLPKFMKSCFLKKSPPGPLLEFLKYLLTLKHDTNPDYKKIKKMFKSALDTSDKLILFQTKSPKKRTPSKSPVKKAASKRKSNGTPASTPKVKNTRKKKNLDDDDEEEEESASSTEEVISSRGRQRVQYAEDTDEEPSRRTPSESPVKKAAYNRKNNGTPTSSPKVKNARNKKNLDDDEEELASSSDEEPRMRTPSKSPVKKTASKRKSNDTPATTPKVKNARKKKNLDDDDDEEECTSGAEEVITSRGRQRVKYAEEPKKTNMKTTKKVVTSKETLSKGDNESLNGYTDAMKEIYLRKIEKDKLKGKHPRGKPKINDMEGFTDSMKEISLKMKEKKKK